MNTSSAASRHLPLKGKAFNNVTYKGNGIIDQGYSVRFKILNFPTGNTPSKKMTTNTKSINQNLMIKCFYKGSKFLSPDTDHII